MNFDLSEISKRIARLEQNRGASLRFGTVTEVSEAKGTARVQLLDGEGMVSHPLRILQERTGKDQKQCFPDIGESVACLFSGQGFEEGVIMGATYNKKAPSPNKAKGVDYIKYQDGTEICYNRETHELQAYVKGSVSLVADKDITIIGNIHVKGSMLVEQDVIAGAISLQNHTHGGVDRGSSSTNKPQ